MGNTGLGNSKTHTKEFQAWAYQKWLNNLELALDVRTRINFQTGKT